jgi:hypothetical protein
MRAAILDRRAIEGLERAEVGNTSPVEILALAANEDEAVDRTRAASTPAGPDDRAPDRACGRLGDKQARKALIIDD